MESKTGNVGFRSIFVIALAAAFIVSGFFAPNNVLAEQSPNITIITPDGTTSWRGVQEISWTDVSNSPPYKIFYSSNFSTFQNLISNVSETSFEWDTTGNGEVVGVTDGTYQIKVENLKGEFNVSNQFIIDNTPPTTTIDGIGGTPGNDNWWVSVPSITLHCEDVLSGCNETFYRWNGNPDDPNGFSLYENESSIVDAPEGENVLFFFSTDNARDKEGKNNQEAVKQCNDPDICPDGLIKVDTTFPDIASYTLNGEGANAFFNPVDGQSVDIFITADEPVEYNRIKILDETLTEVKFFTQTGVFQTTASKNWDGTGQTGDGEYTLQVNIEDMAGNTVDDLDLVPHIIVVDTTDPSINSFTEPMDDEVYKDSVPVVFKASDLNGITCAYQVNGDDPVDFACNNGSETNTSISEGLNEGRNSIAFIITDAAGNDIAQALISIVFDTDDTLTVDDDAPADFDNIQEAIEKATAGDTIQVVDGTYTEPIGTCDGNDAMFCVDKSLTITGDPGAQGETIDDAGPGLGASVINGGGAFASAFVIDNGVSNVTIEGFEIHNFANNPGAFTGGIGSAIFSWNTGATNITVQDNYLHNLGWNGVLVGSDNGTTQSEWTVKRNIIEAADYAGIELTNVISSEVAFNKVIIGDGISWDPDDSGVGIEVAVRDYGTTVTAGTGVSVHDNEIDGNAAPPERAGINILSRAYQAASNALLTGVSVENNTVTGAARGIYVVAEARNGGIAAVESLSITGNTFNGNGEGLVIFDLVDSSGTATHNGISVVNNDITNSTDGASGVHIETDTAATGITINNNNITSNLGFGVNNEGIGVLNATNNWWGDASGPMIDTNPGGLGDAVSTNVIYSPWCTAVPSGDPLDCPLGSNGPLFEFLLTFNPLSPITIPNATTLTVTAVDDIGITLVNETGEVELSGDGSTQFDGISGLAFKSFFDGVLTTELTKTTPGTVNIVAKDAGVKRGEAQITFEGITPEPFVVDEERVVSDTGVPTDLYTDGWRHTFFLTINATDETDLWVRFGRGENFSIPNWLNVSDGESNIPVTGNMRVLFNTVTGGDLPVRVGGLTEDDIIDGFSGVVSFEIGNSFNDQKVNGTSTAMNTAGLDTNLSASGRQIRFHIFTKIPEGTATGFYETGYEIRLGNE